VSTHACVTHTVVNAVAADCVGGETGGFNATLLYNW